LKYLVLTFRTPRFRADVLDAHYAFLDRLRQAGRLEIAGPFTDRSGGAYLLHADNIEEAKALAFSDPVHVEGCSALSVYEWDAK
jgi:uncharacterized protein YciI